ncbi:MAG TPA: hypothetical protein QF517_00255 [Pseudomonadales bacterium]|nr:hypothetical protein [Pseudomonadales bacterium]
MPDGKPSSDQKGSKGEQGETAEQRNERQKAGGDLQEAGEKIASAGAKIGDQAQAGGGSELPSQFPQQPPEPNARGDEPPDPLIPDTDSTSESEELVFDESESKPSKSVASNDSSSPPGESSNVESSQAAELETGANESSSGESEINAEITATQDALEQASEALRTAGEAVASAESDEELAEAEQLLAQARITVILAAQDLELLEETLGDPSLGEDDLFEEAENALDEANILLVIATQSVLNAKTGLPDFPDGLPATGIPTTGSEQIGQLDEELDQSLVIFEGRIEDARGTIVNSTPPPITDSSQTRRQGNRGLDLMEVGDQPVGDQPVGDQPVGDQPAGDEPEAADQKSPGEEQIASVIPQVPEDMPSPQGDDIVAQQLREAAIAETDPKLKEKLWEEYRRYKAGL